MKKKQLLKRIEELEKRVADLENPPTNFVKNPSMNEWTGPGYITSGTPLPQPAYWITCNSTMNGPDTDG